jgi:hypothetical protein
MITRVAIRYRGTVYSLPKPNRHSDVIKYMISEGQDALAGEQGFMTDRDEFLGRRNAHDHALACGQVSEGNLVRPGSLSSDDLW